MKSSDTLSNISINDKINKEMNLSENDFSILNENFFINQKKQIEILKRGIKNKELVEQDDNNLIDHKYLILFSTKLTLEFLFKWDYAEYDFDYQDGEEVPYISN